MKQGRDGARFDVRPGQLRVLYGIDDGIYVVLGFVDVRTIVYVTWDSEWPVQEWDTKDCAGDVLVVDTE